MAKNKISEYSATSADNTDISNINIAEGCSPANVNNAIRTLMAQIKDLQAGTSGDTIPITAGGTGSTTATDARTALSAAKSGANSDITSLTGLTTPLTIAQGGTGASTSATAAFALKGANADITSITGLTTALTVAQGGTGSTALTANSVVLGNGTSALSANLIAPSTSGNVLTSNGTTWQSSANNKLTQATAVASTSGTSIDFTSIPSWVKRITVMFAGVSTNGSNNYLIQLGSGSVATTGYASRAFRDATNAATATNGFLLTAANNANVSTFGGIATISNVTGDSWVFTSILADNGNGNNDYAGGYLSTSLSGTLDRIRITTVGGTDTFDAGSINILYE